MKTEKKIYIAGHTGLLGSALVRYYKEKNTFSLITATRKTLDLTDGKAVHDFIATNKPEIIIIAAGRVGGIQANTNYPADFIYDNLMIEANIIHAAWKVNVKKLLNFGSGCMYPKICSQPMSPDMLLTGSMEKTSEPYAIAKISGLIMVDSFNKQYKTGYINAIPSNMYGPGETFKEDISHVIPALIKKIHHAKQNNNKEVVLWGTGKVTREFLFVDDAAEACAILLEKYDGLKTINISNGTPVSIKELAETISEVIDFSGELVWDTSKPDGSMQKSLETSPLQQLGWKPKISLREGIKKTYNRYLNFFGDNE